MSYLIGIFLQNPFAIFAFWILAFLSILGLSLELRHRHAFDVATSLLVTSLATLNILYWAAYIDFHIAQAALIAVGVFCLLLRNAWLARDKVTYLLLMILVLWFALMCVNTVPFSWDEFFWTLFDQHITTYSNYWDTQSGILITHIRYMPGAAIWHSFFGIKGHYNEATAYFAISVLFLIIFYWLSIQVATAHRLFLIAVMVLSLGCFSEGWFLLYVDPFLGLMMALALVSGARYFEGDANGFPIFILALTGAILFKETGITLMLAVVATLVVSIFSVARKNIEWRRFGWSLTYCLVIFLAWKYYQSSIGAANPVQAHLFLDYSDRATLFRAGILKDFVKYISTSYTMLAIWAVFLMIMFGLRRSGASRMTVLFLLFTVLGYLAIHLIAWLYLVGDGLVGSTRYMGSLLMSLFIFYAIHRTNKAGHKWSTKVVLLGLLAWAPINLLWMGIKPSALFMLLTPHPKQVPVAREKLAQLRATISPDLLALCRSRPTKVWFVYQGSIGYEAMMARHLMTPCQVAPGSFSLGTPYAKDDIWTANYNDDQFLEMASLYPLMLIVNVDDNFTKKYGHFFTSLPQAKVTYQYDGGIRRFRAFPLKNADLPL